MAAHHTTLCHTRPMPDSCHITQHTMPQFIAHQAKFTHFNSLQSCACMSCGAVQVHAGMHAPVQRHTRQAPTLHFRLDTGTQHSSTSNHTNNLNHTTPTTIPCHTTPCHTHHTSLHTKEKTKPMYTCSISFHTCHVVLYSCMHAQHYMNTTWTPHPSGTHITLETWLFTATQEHSTAIHHDTPTTKHVGAFTYLHVMWCCTTLHERHTHQAPSLHLRLSHHHVHHLTAKWVNSDQLSSCTEALKEYTNTRNKTQHTK